jgi:hypothetical protein
MPKVILVVGKKKTGKSTLIASLFYNIGKDRPCFIYDKNNEYYWKYKIINNYKGKIEDNQFIDAVSSLKNSFIVYEEASTYLSGISRASKEANKIKNLITRSRHSNNILILAFTSLADIPPFIYSDSDYIALYKTNDFPSTIDTKFKRNEEFMHHYNLVRSSENKNYYEFFEIT